MNAAFQTIMINKIRKLKEIVKNIIRANQQYKTLKLLEATDLNSCVIFAENIYQKLMIMLTRMHIYENETLIIDTLQAIIAEISTLISLYGCDTLENLIAICIGNNYPFDENYKARYNLLNTYVHPIAYKTLDWKTTLKPNDDNICKTADNFECFDINSQNNNFKNNFSVLKVAIHNVEKQNTLVVYSMIEDVLLEFIDDAFIQTKLSNLQTLIGPNASEIGPSASETGPSANVIGASETGPNKANYERYIKCLTLKELLVHSNTFLWDKFIEYNETMLNDIIKKSLFQIINDFEVKTLVQKRHILITLLINSDANECHYLAYLLYDLLSNDINGIVDTYDQTELYESLPYHVKKYFHEAMKHTINYTNKLSKPDTSKISLEQRICLMKTEEHVKEKAMVKLKEVKMKAEDTGSKAMQYLEGLLKIPFGIYKEEPILRLIPTNSKLFSALVAKLPKNKIPFPVQTQYMNLEVQRYYPLLEKQYKPELQCQVLKSLIQTGIKAKLIMFYTQLNEVFKQPPLLALYPSIKCAGKKVGTLRKELTVIIENLYQAGHIEALDIIYNFIAAQLDEDIKNNSQQILCCDLTTSLNTIDKNIERVNEFMQNMTGILDSSVYGHSKAKRQIERIIGQWLNGDITGYCFGFEGPPGVGKTSLAKKGISCCLTDENKVARPFAFIAMGGSTNSSTLDGHNYTYVGSSWGRIVDILMDTKIMNPIIFIDELDKVSKTENGKEIIGILTHLIDPTQNDAFQDKYFNGISLNLSRALFIFSYNDVDAIDRILLDRIHRIKFDALTMDDKLVITRKFILPEIYQKMGLNAMLAISDDVITMIIDDYTSEPGVRKLKEIMFEIMGEINLEIMKKNTYATTELPMVISMTDIKEKYLKDRNEIRPMKIHAEPQVGVINGMWANSLGKGGILPIEATFYPSATFLDLKLTGMQGDVMKESMTVAKSLAWSLFSRETTKTKTKTKTINVQQKLEKNKNQGIHIHVPEGATPKDGPSAGTAITMVLYSLFSERKIRNDVAITGEICLQGRVTAIGGLDLKLLGGIRAGVKRFIYPKENAKDFKNFMEIYQNKPLLLNIEFIAVETIDEVLPLIFA
jgi:ATP-dependent Lon protease